MSNEIHKQIGTIWPLYRPYFSGKHVKTCKVCYRKFSLAQFKSLKSPDAGEIQDLCADDDDPGKYALLRNCFCGDTLAIILNSDMRFYKGEIG